jgi:hypothetical protein
MRGKDGSFLYSERECLNLIELILDRARNLWSEEASRERGERGRAAGAWAAPGKPTGRGKLFWIDSE